MKFFICESGNESCLWSIKLARFPEWGLQMCFSFFFFWLIDWANCFSSASLCAVINRFSLSDFIPQEAVKTENNEHINLKVAGQDGSVVQFKIKRHTPLIKLMKAYCERQVGTAPFQHTTTITDWLWTGYFPEPVIHKQGGHGDIEGCVFVQCNYSWIDRQIWTNNIITALQLHCNSQHMSLSLCWVFSCVYSHSVT